MGEKRNVGSFDGEARRKETTGRRRHRWTDNTKIVLEK
jgi:hypothetical protein